MTAARCVGAAGLRATLIAGAVLLLAGTATAQPAVGQLLGAFGGGGRGEGNVSDETARAAISAAQASYAQAARELAADLRTGEGAALSRADVDARIDSEIDGFVVDARRRLMEARGDGLLSQRELSSALSEERSERLENLEAVLAALRQGAATPPERSDAGSWWEWAGLMLGYTLLERNEAWRWGVCLSLLAGGLVLAGLLGRGLTHLASRLGGRGARGAARAAESLSGPLYVAGAAVAVRAALSFVWLPGGTGDVLRRASSVLIALSLLWLGWRAASGVASFVAWTTARTRGEVDDELVDLIRKGLRIGALGLFAAFSVNALLGVELGSILATVGVLGIVASIAAQDTLRNVMGAFTVYGDRPFAPGDLVRIKDYFGKVEEIGFRSTRVRTLEGHCVVVPNAEVVREPVENVSARPSVRHHYAIDLVYATPPDRVRRAVEIALEVLRDADPPEDQEPRVSFEALAPYSLRLMVWYYSDTSDYWEARAHRTEVNLALLERFREEGLEFAFPTRSLHLLPGDAESTGVSGRDASEEEGEATGDEEDAASEREAG